MSACPPFPPHRTASVKGTRFVDVCDVYTGMATLTVAGFAVGSIVDWDWPVETLWLSPRALSELGLQDGCDIGVFWSRTCGHGKHKVGQSVNVRVASGWLGNEAMLVVAQHNPLIYCRVYYP